MQFYQLSLLFSAYFILFYREACAQVCNFEDFLAITKQVRLGQLLCCGRLEYLLRKYYYILWHWNQYLTILWDSDLCSSFFANFFDASTFSSDDSTAKTIVNQHLQGNIPGWNNIRHPTSHFVIHLCSITCVTFSPAMEGVKRTLKPEYRNGKDSLHAT